jgi:hypothetical protein
MMIYEPYINRQTGDLAWFRDIEHAGGHPWQQYTCFEREFLKKLGWTLWIDTSDPEEAAFYLDTLNRGVSNFDSKEVMTYPAKDYNRGSEHNRVENRASFLATVSDKLGVEWLPNAAQQLRPSPYCTCEDGEADPNCSMHQQSYPTYYCKSPGHIYHDLCMGTDRSISCGNSGCDGLWKPYESGGKDHETPAASASGTTNARVGEDSTSEEAFLGRVLQRLERTSSGDGALVLTGALAVEIAHRIRDLQARQAAEPSRAKSAHVEDVPGRDCYTKAEVDDLLESLVYVLMRHVPLNSQEMKELDKWLSDWLKLKE